MHSDDHHLLQRFVDDRSEAAFAELVQRHVDLVYSTARRLVGGDRHLAQDVTQTVFADLARKAARLVDHPAPAGWLHRHTFFVASGLVRAGMGSEMTNGMIVLISADWFTSGVVGAANPSLLGREIGSSPPQSVNNSGYAMRQGRQQPGLPPLPGA